MDAVVYSKAVTVSEYAKGLEEGLSRTMVETMAMTSDLLAAMPMKPSVKGKYKYMQIAELPGVAFRGLNERGNESTGKFTLAEEGIYYMDEYIKVDIAIVKELGMEQRAKQHRLKAISMSQKISQTLVNGDNSTQIREFDGFKRRCLTLNKTLFHNSAGVGGAALSLANLDVVHRAVNGMTHWLFPYDLMAYMDSAARNPALINNSVTQAYDTELGRTVTKLHGKPILYGYDPDDTPALLDFTEVGSGGGAAVTGSIYALALRGDRTFMIEGSPLETRDEGILQGEPWYSTHCSWYLGMVNEHPRALARLTSLTKAAVVA
jgi:hypothetical protein